MSVFQSRKTVIAGSSETIVLPEELSVLPVTIQVGPGSGGTMAVYGTCDTAGFMRDNPDEVEWSPVVSSVSTSSIVAVSTPVTAIKAEATTADGVIIVMVSDNNLRD